MIYKTIAASILASACFGVASIPVLAQSPNSDAQYCGALINTYQKYIVGAYDPDMTTHVHANLDTAVANCQSGNTAAGIPPLEKALRDAKFSLPPRA
jgi:hypothetical protein